MYGAFVACCAGALFVLLLVPSARADIAKGNYGAIVSARNAEKEALLAECPYVRLRDDLFARYVRDPGAVADEGDVVVDSSWVIVQPAPDDAVAVKMGAMLPELFPVVGSEYDDGPIVNALLFKPGDEPAKGPVQV